MVQIRPIVFFRTRDSAEIKPVDDEQITPVYGYYSWELTRRSWVQSHIIGQKNFEQNFCVITSFCGKALGSLSLMNRILYLMDCCGFCGEYV